MTHCKHCGSSELIRLSSIDSKLCNTCKSYQHWPLDAGQASVLEKRVGKLNKGEYDSTSRRMISHKKTAP